ncbi:MAG: hypothetical protein U5L02_05770 [Rheinheimera sp.]|nr:hypothetical protein [Rheinheimera sp.]
MTESRPLSKTKNWVATRLVQKAALMEACFSLFSAAPKSDREFGRFLFRALCGLFNHRGGAEP